MSEYLTVESRFHGPPDAGNGGYVAGLLARFIGDPAQVTLRRPAPLDRPLEVIPGDSRALLMDGDALIAEAAPADPRVDLPPPVTFEDAQAAARDYPGFRTHPFPGCFVCGPERRFGEGLRIFPGPIAGMEGLVAAPWVPDTSLGAGDGNVRPEFVWAALDCPGGWALIDHAPGRYAVLGQLAARLITPVRSGERYVVAAWPLGAEGRKMYAGSAVFAASGDACAAARATWIRLR